MPGGRQDTYLETRVAILRSRLMPLEAIDRLIEGGSLEGMAQRWQTTAPLDELDTTTVERLGMHALLSDLAVILRPLSDEARDFFVFWASAR